MTQPLYPPNDPRARQPHPSQAVPEARLVQQAQPVAEESGSEIDDEAIHYELQQLYSNIRPCLWFLGASGFGFGLMVVARIMLILVAARGQMLALQVMVSLLAIVVGGVLMLLSYQLIRYAARIRDYLDDPTRYWVERTLDTQRSVWKSLTILMLLGIVLTVLLTVAIVAGAILQVVPVESVS